MFVVEIKTFKMVLAVIGRIWRRILNIEETKQLRDDSGVTSKIILLGNSRIMGMIQIVNFNSM